MHDLIVLHARSHIYVSHHAGVIGWSNQTPPCTNTVLILPTVIQHVHVANPCTKVGYIAMTVGIYLECLRMNVWMQGCGLVLSYAHDPSDLYWQAGARHCRHGLKLGNYSAERYLRAVAACYYIKAAWECSASNACLP